MSDAAEQVDSRLSNQSASGLSVVHVVDNLRLGGTELNVLKISKALKSRGADVRVVLIGESGPLATAYRDAAIEIERVPVGRFYSPLLYSRLQAISRAVHRGDPTIVHSHDRYSNFTIALCPRPRTAGCRYIASHRSGLPASPLWRNALRFAFSRADLVTANGAVAAEIASRMMPGNQIVAVTPNFLEDWCFEENSQRWQDSDPASDLGASVVQLGFVGRLEPVKRVDRLLLLARRLKELSVPFRLSIVGEGSLRARLENQARDLSLESTVVFLGELPRRPLPQRNFDILLLSSSSEGTPNVIVEAMACGVPVVATNVGGVSAVVDHEVTGLLVPVDDADALFNAVYRLMSSGDLRVAYGEAARRRAQKEWREASVIERLIGDVYYQSGQIPIR